MPPKTVICAVCGQTVLKAQTYARADGSRACKTHEGVAEEAERLRAEQAVAAQQKREAPKRKPWEPSEDLRNEETRFYEEEAHQFREWANTHCWTCSREGISLRDYFANAMVAIERLQMRGEFNFLTMPQDIMRLQGNPLVLAMVPYDDDKDQRIYRAITNWKIKDIIHFLRCVNICVECAAKFGVQDRIDALLPKPTWEQVQAIMPAVVALEPVLKEMAEKKEREN